MPLSSSIMRFALIISAGTLMISEIATSRQFTNNQGKQINAQIVAVEGEKVQLKLRSNKNVYDIDIATLSKEDQDYIKKWQTDNQVEESAEESTKKDSGYTRGNFSHTALKKEFKLTDNFTSEWPSLVTTDIPEIKTVKEADKEFIYESQNYQFICDVELSQSVVKKFAHLFESTRNYCKALPISMMKAQIPKGYIKYKILLFESEQSYIKNGGPAGSAGVYMPREDVIMVPLTSLGVKKVGSSYRYDFDGSNKTLPHEITHQLTNPEYFSPGAMGWFSEGLAEYVAMTDYRGGKFMVRGSENAIEEAVTGFERKSGRGRNLGTEFTAPDLKGYMTMSYGQFVENGNFNYGLGALITCYFFHLEEDESRESINNFLTALNEGKTGDEALKSLLNGRSFDELEKDIHDAWRSKGVKINFK